MTIDRQRSVLSICNEKADIVLINGLFEEEKLCIR
jgi:hypothetical protein